MLQSLLIQRAAAPVGLSTALDAIDLREIALRASCGKEDKGGTCIYFWSGIGNNKGVKY